MMMIEFGCLEAYVGRTTPRDLIDIMFDHDYCLYDLVDCPLPAVRPGADRWRLHLRQEQQRAEGVQSEIVTPGSEVGVKVVALAGGTGGAKLAHGLQAVLPPGDLTVIANTGDDTERHGLLVMPDHDAVMYMLAGRFDDERGWGVAGETWTVMDGLAEYGEEAWFRLGDRDFATHIARTARLRRGRSPDRRSCARSRRRSASRPRSCRWPTSRSAPRSGPTTAGSTSRSTSSTATRRPRSARSASTGRARTTDGRVAGALADGRGHRHRAVQPDRLDRADPGRARDAEAIGAARARRRPGRRGQPASSAASRSRARPTGCWPRSVTNRAPGEWPRSYAGTVDAFVLDEVDAALEPDIAALGLPHAGDRHDHGRPRRAGPAGPDRRSGSPDDAGSRRSSRSARSRAPRRGSARRSMRRSGTTSSRASWHGPWWPPWPSTGLDDVLVVSPDREVLRRARRPRRPDPAPALQRPQPRAARGAGRRRRRRRDGDPRAADRSAVRQRRRPSTAVARGARAADGRDRPRRPSSSSPTATAPAPTRSACGRRTSSTSPSARAAARAHRAAAEAAGATVHRARWPAGGRPRHRRRPRLRRIARRPEGLGVG